MRLFRIGHEKYADSLSGEGARLHGGRWNKPGSPCIYTSYHLSLCVLEYAANVPLHLLPPSLCTTEYELPEALITIVKEEDLPKDWHVTPSAESSRVLGSAMLRKASVVAFRIPSAVIPEEYNVVVNPQADGFDAFRIVSIQPFDFDKRIKQ